MVSFQLFIPINDSKRAKKFKTNNIYEMKIIMLTLIIFLTPSVFADARQREIEYEAINLVIKKYGKGLENRLKGTGVNPSYRSWYENDCFVSVAAGTNQEYNWSSLEWFSVNVCSDSAEIMKDDRRK